MSKIIQCFFGADMRCSHDGLAKIARAKKVDVNELNPGQYVIFVNAAKNRLKMYAAHNVVAYYRARGSERINLTAIAYIPAAFNGTDINYDAALKKALVAQLDRREAAKR